MTGESSREVVSSFLRGDDDDWPASGFSIFSLAKQASFFLALSSVSTWNREESRSLGDGESSKSKAMEKEAAAAAAAADEEAA